MAVGASTVFFIAEAFAVNPARAYACGDERADYLAAVAGGMHPFMVAYGFESFERLEKRIGVPRELISVSPEQLRHRLLHALDLDAGASRRIVELQQGSAPADVPVVTAAGV